MGAAACRLLSHPDNKPEMGLLPDTQGGCSIYVANKHTSEDTHCASRIVDAGRVSSIRDVQTVNTDDVFLCTNAYTHTRMLGRSRSVSASPSFVQIIIEMKAE